MNFGDVWHLWDLYIDSAAAAVAVSNPKSALIIWEIEPITRIIRFRGRFCAKTLEPLDDFIHFAWLHCSHLRRRATLNIANGLTVRSQNFRCTFRPRRILVASRLIPAFVH